MRRAVVIISFVLALSPVALSAADLIGPELRIQIAAVGGPGQHACGNGCYNPAPGEQCFNDHVCIGMGFNSTWAGSD